MQTGGCLENQEDKVFCAHNCASASRKHDLPCTHVHDCCSGGGGGGVSDSAVN